MLVKCNKNRHFLDTILHLYTHFQKNSFLNIEKKMIFYNKNKLDT